VLVRLLWPKMRKRSGRLGGKGAPGSARAAILNFLAALAPGELRPLLALLLSPLGPALRPPPAGALPEPAAAPAPAAAAAAHAQDGVASEATDGSSRHAPEPGPAQPAPEADLFEEPWWAAELGAPGRGAAWWLAAADARALAALPARTRLGFLNAAADALARLGHRLGPYLPALAALGVAALEAATAGLPRAAAGVPLVPAPEAPRAGAPAGEPGGRAGPGQAAGQPRAGAVHEGGRSPDAAAPGEGPRPDERPAGCADPGAPQQRGEADGPAEGGEPGAGRPGDGGREVGAGARPPLAGLGRRFPDGADWAPLWPRFLAAAEPLALRLPTEARGRFVLRPNPGRLCHLGHDMTFRQGGHASTLPKS